MSHKRKGINAKVKKVEKPKPKIDLTTQLTNFQKICPVPLLTDTELNQFKELLKLSNSAGAVMKDISEKEVNALKMREIVKRIRLKEIKPPLFQEILPKTYAPYEDMETVSKMVKQNIKMVEDAVQFGKGQLGHRYEEYVDALIRMRDKCNKMIGDATIKRISPHRIGAETDKGETKVFDNKFEEFVEKAVAVEESNKKKTKK